MEEDFKDEEPAGIPDLLDLKKNIIERKSVQNSILGKLAKVPSLCNSDGNKPVMDPNRNQDTSTNATSEKTMQPIQFQSPIQQRKFLDRTNSDVDLTNLQERTENTELKHWREVVSPGKVDDHFLFGNILGIGSFGLIREAVFIPELLQIQNGYACDLTHESDTKVDKFIRKPSG